MLSYRHGFHAGNHADVLKHATLVFLLAYLSRKDKPWWYVDTHAGGACYDLTGDWARKNAEFETGIARLWQRTDLPPALADYVEHVRRLNPDGTLRFYPGSPQLALQCARTNDRLKLFELHGSESEALQQHFATTKRQVTMSVGDGFDGLASVLPPPPRRGLVLIDPSYEVRTDYARVIVVLKDALRRFATGIYMVWYPLIQKREAREFPASLQRLAESAGVDWLDTTLTVRTPAVDGLGMHGSGVFVINPPWTLPAMLRETLPCLEKLLAQDTAATTTLAHRIA